MKKLLLIIDMQNDFIDGSLGTKEAEEIVKNVAEKAASFDGDVIFTRDTHFENYLDTEEGKNLPVKHCIKGTAGWEICDALKNTEVYKKSRIIDKLTFGSSELAGVISEEKPDEVYIVGLCTDICVISNAMIVKAFSPETVITVYSDCCAGVTPESHQNALNAMKMCQVIVK